LVTRLRAVLHRDGMLFSALSYYVVLFPSWHYIPQLVSYVGSPNSTPNAQSLIQGSYRSGNLSGQENILGGKVRGNDKIGATRCQIFRLKCIEFDFRWVSAPDPAGGAYSTPPDLLAALNIAL